MGGATPFSALRRLKINISIHAPRGGSDRYSHTKACRHRYFNPRSPWGERLLVHGAFVANHRFQSTLPVGGATGDLRKLDTTAKISIHAPRGGSDDYLAANPPSVTISIHAPRGGSDRIHRSVRHPTGISIHAPRGGSDKELTDYRQWQKQFQSTLPVGGATAV